MSPRPGPRRPYVPARLDPDQLDWLDAEAEARGLNRSEMLRAAVSFAMRKMGRPTHPRDK